MPRRSRIVVKGAPHHIVQRGNFKQNVFENFNEFRQYCYFINEYQSQYAIEILSYCLMNNHVHFIVIPMEETDLGGFFRTVHMRYSQYKNNIEKRKGHLWQGRFFSSILDRNYLLNALRYVERNPVRAHITSLPWDYCWSSARFRVGLDQDSIIKINNYLETLGNLSVDSWKKFLTEHNETHDSEIRYKTAKGYAIGSPSFVAKLEKEIGVSLSERAPGRPRK